MSERGSVATFIREKRPVLGAFRDVLIVWRHLILRTPTFFELVRTSPKLSIKNAVVFCLCSATLIAVAIVGADRILAGVADMLGRPYGRLKIGSFFAIELGVVLYFAFAGLLWTLFTFVPARMLRRDVRLKKIFVGTLYMSTFLVSFSGLFGIAGLLIVAFSQAQGGHPRIGLARLLYEHSKGPVSSPVQVWEVAFAIWLDLVIPVFSLTAATVMTGIRARTLLLLNLALAIGVAAFVLLLCFLAYLIFGTGMQRL